ncbi:hypothetical protein [Massilia scottii]|uniref:hypothetical protein n=1 Tax=Massilia scottii TaxID=3057166 RepID=UPI0035B565E7
MFPASFGGRRTNNGIYCEKHNNAFGRHVSALLSGVDIVNALIGVVPDRKDEVRPAPATSADGEQFLVAGGKVTLAPPPSLDQRPELLGKQLQIGFANEAQARKWIAEQERAGYKVATGAFSAPQTKIFGEALHARRCLGDEDFMRGLLYLALTFVAHTDPELARSEGLTEVRTIVEKDGAVEGRALWEPPSTLTQISANPFAHGHTVVTGPDASCKRLVALISLYGAIHFGIDLGDLAEGNVPERVTTHIDPLAPRPPQDVQVTRERVALTLSTLKESTAYLSQLRAGEVDPLSDVLHDASVRELLEASRATLKELQKISSLPVDEQISKVLALLSVHDQRIFNWMRTGFLGYSESEPKIPEAVRFALQTFVSLDNSAPKGLTQESESALEVARALLTDQIIAALKQGILDEKKLASLIGGGDGLGIVLHFFVQLILNQRPR